MNSYSYSGEGVLAYKVLAASGDRTGTYIDIGANLPTNYNNMYLFYERGWNGVCIEPATALYDALC